MAPDTPTGRPPDGHDPLLCGLPDLPGSPFCPACQDEALLAETAERLRPPPDPDAEYPGDIEVPEEGGAG